MNIIKVKWLCNSCINFDIEGITVSSVEELNIIMQEHHVVHFNCCYSIKFNLPTNFTKIFLEYPHYAYNCQENNYPNRNNNNRFMIVDTIFLKEYKIYDPRKGYQQTIDYDNNIKTFFCNIESNF